MGRFKSVFRLELCGVGPYRYGDDGKHGRVPKKILDVSVRLEFTHTRGNHPSWIADDIDRPLRSRHLSGFLSMADLEDWFDGFLPELLDCGFRIVEYVADVIFIGTSERQVVFDPKLGGSL